MALCGGCLNMIYRYDRHGEVITPNCCNTSGSTPPPTPPAPPTPGKVYFPQFTMKGIADLLTGPKTYRYIKPDQEALMMAGEGVLENSGGEVLIEGSLYGICSLLETQSWNPRYTGGSNLVATKLTGVGTGLHVDVTVDATFVVTAIIPNAGNTGAAWVTNDTMTFTDATGFGCIGTVTALAGAVTSIAITSQTGALGETITTQPSPGAVGSTNMAIINFPTDKIVTGYTASTFLTPPAGTQKIQLYAIVEWDAGDGSTFVWSDVTISAYSSGVQISDFLTWTVLASRGIQELRQDSIVITIPAGGTSLELRVLINNQVARAGKHFNVSFWETCVDFLPAPVNVVSMPISNEIDVSWEPVATALYYEIQRSSTLYGTYSFLGFTTGLYWFDTTVANGQTAFYRIIAVSSTNFSHPSMPSMAATAAVIPVGVNGYRIFNIGGTNGAGIPGGTSHYTRGANPPSPTPTTIPLMGLARPTSGISSPSSVSDPTYWNNSTNYRITPQVGRGNTYPGGVTFFLINTINASNGAGLGETYDYFFWTVAGYNGTVTPAGPVNGQQVYESFIVVGAPTLTPPSAPTGLAVTTSPSRQYTSPWGEGTVTSVALNWNAVTGAKYYTVYQLDSGGSIVANFLFSTLNTSLTVDTMTIGATYKYAVSAVTENGESALSSTLTFVAL